MWILYFVIVAAFKQTSASIVTVIYIILICSSTVLVIPDGIPDLLKMVNLFEKEVFNLLWIYTNPDHPEYNLELIHWRILWLLETKVKYSHLTFNHLQDLSHMDPSYKDLINADSKLNKLEICLEKVKKDVQGKIDSKV